jgi:hypothetical protein
METCRMEFSGKLLKRGFWLYVWDIKEDMQRHVYVGRTGDSSSPNASSPFRRIGQHLDSSLNAKGNALGRQLKTAGINPEVCTFEMTAIGPIFAEQKTMPDHKPLRDKTAALERAIADELKRRGYNVLGTHPRAQEPDQKLLSHVIAELETSFPPRTTDPEQSRRYQPIRAKGGASASEIIIRDRDRFADLGQQNEAAPKVNETQATSRFKPVPIRGEPLSETIIRGRGES